MLKKRHWLYAVQEPVRPDNDEDVESNKETGEAREDEIIVTVRCHKVSNDLDHVEDQGDDGPNNPGHHQTWLSLQREMKINPNICLQLPS